MQGLILIPLAWLWWAVPMFFYGRMVRKMQVGQAALYGLGRSVLALVCAFVVSGGVSTGIPEGQRSLLIGAAAIVWLGLPVAILLAGLRRAKRGLS